MQTTELKTDKTIATDIKSTAEKNKTQNNTAQLNRQSALNYLQTLAKERPDVSEGLQRTLSSLHSNLSKDIECSDKVLRSQGQNGSSDTPYTNLSGKLIDRDKNLQDSTAKLLSTAEGFVRGRDASATLKKAFNDLPLSLKEGSSTGNAIAKAVTEALAELSCHKTMGAGLIRDLSVRGIYLSADEPSIKQKNATTRLLSSTVSFIKNNSHDVLKHIAIYDGNDAPDEAGEAVVQNSKEPSLRSSALQNDRNNDTYLDIFKKNNTDPNENNTLPSEPSERIKQIIARAAEKARRSNLIRTESSVKNSSGNDNTAQNTTNLRELASRASSLERQFRIERQKIAEGGKLPDPAQYPDDQNAKKTETTMSKVSSNTLNVAASGNSPSSKISNLDNAQVKISYSAVQSSFFGSMASVPGMDLPLQDFNADELKTFAAVSEAQVLSSKHVISQVLSEQQRLMSEDGDSTALADPNENIGNNSNTQSSAVSNLKTDPAMKTLEQDNSDNASKLKNTSSQEKSDQEVSADSLKKNITCEQATLSVSEGKSEDAVATQTDTAEKKDSEIKDEESVFAPLAKEDEVNPQINAKVQDYDVESTASSDKKDTANVAVNESTVTKDIIKENDPRIKDSLKTNQNNVSLSEMALANAKALDASALPSNISQEIDSEEINTTHLQSNTEPKRGDINESLTVKDSDAYIDDAENITLSAPLPSVASSVTTGGSMPIPEQSKIEVATANSEGGLFRKIASLFSKNSNENAVQKTQSIAASEVSLKVPSMNTPFDVYLKSLSAVASDSTLAESIKKEALELKNKLLSPLSDLTAADSWLSFVTGPMSPQSPRAIALQQWAFLLLCLRFKQLGKNVAGFLKKKNLSSLDDALDALADTSDDVKKRLEKLCSESLEQISRLQKRDENTHPLLNRPLPLPPSYDGGKEGALMIRKSEDEQKNVWHLTFQFDLKALGAIEIKAVAAFPEIRLSFATETLEGLKAVQNHSVELAQTLENLGFEPKASAPRLGRIRPLSGSHDEKGLADDPAAGISLEI